jgi:hypothetical protein
MDVAGEIQKRPKSIAKSRSFVDWREVKSITRDVDVGARQSPARSQDADASSERAIVS